MWKTGGTIEAINSDELDKTTRGNTYKITHYSRGLNTDKFTIINDVGNEVYPTWTRFKPVRKEDDK